jgi:8-oxo-dGTP pyrophosphatase MutT (NUDIX family)
VASRESLLVELERYRPATEREAAMTQTVRAFLAEHVDAFERTLAVGHLTGSAWVVDRERTHALLTHHKKLGRWLQLGGHADGDPDMRAVAMREAVEESGLAVRFLGDGIYDIDVHVVPARGAEAEHAHYDIRFAFEADRAQPFTVSAESHALAWVPLATLEADESVMRLARKTPALPR